MNTASTSEIIREIARKFNNYATELVRIADRMDQHNDISYAGEAINCVINCLSNCRLDLLATRPIRALQSEINRKE